jgi:GNAT superfamily N-acetyltransferase
MKSEVIGISERVKKTRIGLKDTLAIIDMTLEGQAREHEAFFPYEAFEGLNDLIERTVHGTKIERFRPKEGRPPSHTFEIHTEGGETLGYLNMIYLSKPIPCYYLIYVEILPHFRGRGLGNKILKAFKEFAENKEAIGILDNIIPSDEPTYDIYTKHGWKCIEEFIGNEMVNGEGHYMVFIPKSTNAHNLREKLIRLLFKIKKKRPVIDMHDNESMVKRTIAEFQSVHETLDHLFGIEISSGTSTPFMRFMYTKFTTKVLGFQRRIASLLGYTGGESLEQISISDEIKNLPIQPYSLWWDREGRPEIRGTEEIIEDLPERLKKEPTIYIESLPFYKRPYLTPWLEQKGNPSYHLKISDLLELGFDPTKLREFCLRGVDYIFERISPHLLPSIEKRKMILPKIAEFASGMHFHHTRIQINPPIAILQDRGNVYILRRKVEGIHSEEALDQLRTAPSLKEMNHVAGIDRTVVITINEIKEWLRKVFDPSLHEEIQELTFFIPWDLERNIPRIHVDISGVSLDTLWIA